MKIGLIRTSSIGDVVLASACIDYLRKSAPNAEIFWVGRSPSKELLSNLSTSISVLELSRKSSAVQRESVMRALKGCHVVVDLQTSFRSMILCRTLAKQGIPVFSTAKSKWFRTLLVAKSWMYGRIFKQSVQSTEVKMQYRMMLDSLHEAMKSLGCASTDALNSARPMLHVDNKLLRACSEFSESECSEQTLLGVHAWSKECAKELAVGKWLAVAPGASHETKRAPTEVFFDILTRLQEIIPDSLEPPGLLLLGSQEDRISAVELTDLLNWQGPTLNVAGKLSLEQTTAVLSKVSVLLSNDSGLAHIAESVGVPVAVLFGPTSEQFGFAPQRIDSKAFSSPLGCRPCSKHGKSKCRYKDQLCFLSIDTRSVASFLCSIVVKGSSR